MQGCYVKKFKETKMESRESSTCWFILPTDILADANLSAGWVEVEPGGKNVSYGHTEWRQVFFFMEGNGKLVLGEGTENEEEIPVESPMTVEIPYNRVHTAIATEETPLKYLYVNDYSIKKKC